MKNFDIIVGRGNDFNITLSYGHIHDANVVVYDSTDIDVVIRNLATIIRMAVKNNFSLAIGASEAKMLLGIPVSISETLMLDTEMASLFSILHAIPNGVLDAKISAADAAMLVKMYIQAVKEQNGIAFDVVSPTVSLGKLISASDDCEVYIDTSLADPKVYVILRVTDTANLSVGQATTYVVIHATIDEVNSTLIETSSADLQLRRLRCLYEMDDFAITEFDTDILEAVDFVS